MFQGTQYALITSLKYGCHNFQCMGAWRGKNAPASFCFFLTPFLRFLSPFLEYANLVLASRSDMRSIFLPSLLIRAYLYRPLQEGPECPLMCTFLTHWSGFFKRLGNPFSEDLFPDLMTPPAHAALNITFSSCFLLCTRCTGGIVDGHSYSMAHSNPEICKRASSFPALQIRTET